MPLITAEELVKAGVHFGHRASRWNPKMAPYIYGKRNLIHIIDLRETIRGLIAAHKFVVQLVRDGKDVIFVGTKRQAKSVVKAEAERCEMHYVRERWLGGMLTNFQTVRKRLKRLAELDELVATGEIHRYSKKMISALTREQRKIRRNLEGVQHMNELPGALLIVDPHKEHIAVQEAKKLHIPTICLADTNCDPDMADIIVPGNDDAMKSIQIFCRIMADAALQGKKERLARLGPVTPLQPAGQPQAAGEQAPPAEPAAEPQPAESEPTEPAAEAASEPAAQPAPASDAQLPVPPVAPPGAAPAAETPASPPAEQAAAPAAPQAQADE